MVVVGLSKHVKAVRNMRVKVVVRQSPRRSSEYEADIIVNGKDSVTTGGLWDKKEIIDYIQTTLQYAQAYLNFLSNSHYEEDKKRYLNELRLRLELALAHTLAYETAKD